MVAVSPDNESNNDKDIIFIPKSVGAKARNYDVLDPLLGKYLTLLRAPIYKTQKFLRGIKALRDAVKQGLTQQYAGNPEAVTC